MIHGIKSLLDRYSQVSFEDIYNYYKLEASIKVAKKLVKGLIDRTIQLEKIPKSGAKEPLLSHRKHEYRYLVEGNYKIIYWIDESYIIIAAVFDCRQNPTKMSNLG